MAIDVILSIISVMEIKTDFFLFIFKNLMVLYIDTYKYKHYRVTLISEGKIWAKKYYNRIVIDLIKKQIIYIYFVESISDNEIKYIEKQLKFDYKNLQIRNPGMYCEMSALNMVFRDAQIFFKTSTFGENTLIQNETLWTIKSDRKYSVVTIPKGSIINIESINIKGKVLKIVYSKPPTKKYKLYISL